MEVLESIIDIFRELDNPKMSLSGDNLMVSCPFMPYRHERQYLSNSMGILVDSSGEKPILVNCFSCKFHSKGLTKLFNEMSLYEGVYEKYIPVVKKLDFSTLSFTSLHTDYQSAKQPDDASKDDLFLPYSRLLHPYLIRRKVSIDTAKAWDLGYDRIKKRALFPVKNFGGNVVGAVGRTVVPGYPIKYLEYWDLDKEAYLFGEHLVVEGRPTVVVEGPIDCILVYQYLREFGINYNVVATLGSYVTDKQAEKLVQISSKVIILYDNDSAGELGRKRALKILSRRVLTTVARCDTDPAEAGRKVVDIIRESEIPLYP
jgi:5S rRNA maturation endonuclease (ribonuclease M5)